MWAMARMHMCTRSLISLVHLRELPGAEVLGIHVFVLCVDGALRLLQVLAVPSPEGHNAGVQLACENMLYIHTFE